MHKSLEVHGHGNQEEFKWSTMIDSEEDDDGDDDYNNHPALKRSPSACRLKKRVAVAVIVEKAAPGGHAGNPPNENSDGPAPASNAPGDLYADVDTTSLLVEPTGTFKCCKPPYVTTGNDKSDRKFYKYLCDLKVFIQEHGHCNVRSTYNTRLYQFCYRTNKNVREPAKVRIEALKAIGFKFKESSPHAHHNDQVLKKAPALVPPFWNRTNDDEDDEDDEDDQDCMDRKRSASECDSSNGENGVASIPDSSSKDRDASAPDENDASNNCDQEAAVETSGVNIRISKRESKQTQFLMNHMSTDASRRKPRPATSTKSTKSKKKRKRNDSNNNDNDNNKKRNVAELQGAVKYARVQAREDIYGQQDTTNHAVHNVAPLAQSHEHQRGLLKDIIDLENLCFGENYGGHLLQRLARLEGVLLDERITVPVRAPARIRLLKSKIGSM